MRLLLAIFFTLFATSSFSGVLPKGTPEQQFNYALKKALNEELDLAADALNEFLELHPRHNKNADARYWQGRVLFVLGEFERSAIIFSEFNSLYPNDSRITDTTLWIAQAVSTFANSSQACPIYSNLTKFLRSDAKKYFINELNRLEKKASCKKLSSAPLKSSNLNEDESFSTSVIPEMDTNKQYMIAIRQSLQSDLRTKLGELTDSSFQTVNKTQKSKEINKLRDKQAPLRYEALEPSSFSDSKICRFATVPTTDGGKLWDSVIYGEYVAEAKHRGLTCGVDEISSNQAALSTKPTPNTVSSAEFFAAQRKAERLEAELAALKAAQQQQQQTISNDTRVPLIDQLAANSSGKQGIISGRVRDNTGIAEVTVDGTVVQVRPDGRFEHRMFIPADGKQVLIEATDLAGLTSQKQLNLTRDAAIKSASISFDSLNPLGKRVAKNRDALALIVGVEGYKNTPAQAIYADSDAKMFRDYASEKLGIPDNRIETLINDGAELTDMLLSVKNWLARSVKQDRTDVYVFFAGHGLASDDGEKMYLLPYDGSPQLLDRTAILRDELFSDIAAANPRSVTVFLDTCYSGTTRGTDMLVASRPIAIRAKQQNIPDGFTVFTAAGGDQTAKPLEEAKHGMFSYFLMKGMEGDADSNSDNQITAAELHEYVEQNVVQQSGGSQVPELQGDAGRVLVRYQ